MDTELTLTHGHSHFGGSLITSNLLELHHNMAHLGVASHLSVHRMLLLWVQQTNGWRCA